MSLYTIGYNTTVSLDQQAGHRACSQYQIWINLQIFILLMLNLKCVTLNLSASIKGAVTKLQIHCTWCKTRTQLCSLLWARYAPAYELCQITQSVYCHSYEPGRLFMKQELLVVCLSVTHKGSSSSMFLQLLSAGGFKHVDNRLFTHHQQCITHTTRRNGCHIVVVWYKCLQRRISLVTIYIKPIYPSELQKWM